jgi:uncharacterized membrane protein YhhN
VIALTRWLPALTVASAMLAIANGTWALDQRALLLVFKPLTTLLIIAHAWRRGLDAPAARRFVLAGLWFSLVGDVALMWPQRGFVPGLIAFLIGHGLYIGAFTREHRFAALPAALAAYALIAGTILAFLWDAIPAGLRIPVAGYVLALTAMAAQTAVVALRAQGDDVRRARGLMIGGALFMVSDTVLAINRFSMPIPAAGLWILATYWAAQWLIASWLRPAAPTLASVTAGRLGSAG